MITTRMRTTVPVQKERQFYKVKTKESVIVALKGELKPSCDGNTSLELCVAEVRMAEVITMNKRVIEHS